MKSKKESQNTVENILFALVELQRAFWLKWGRKESGKKYNICRCEKIINPYHTPYLFGFVRPPRNNKKYEASSPCVKKKMT